MKNDATTYWQGRTVLVTGAEGFIGSTLVEQLLARGAKVRGFAHYKPYGDRGHLANLQNDVEIVSGDVRDPGRAADAVAGCEVVFHLAALIGIPYSYQAPESYVQTNTAGTHNVAAACLRHGVARMVHTSTSEVYGTARTAPIDETHPLQPQSPYSASKIGADMMALSYAHAFDLPVSVVRPFNTYGPKQSARAVIPAILGQLHAGATQIKLGATTPTRDFTFSEDTARGFLAVAQSDRTVGEVVNIGSGQEISIGALAELLIEVTGSPARVVRDEGRIRPSGSEVERLLCDATKAHDLTGWKPQVPLREGLLRTSEWLRQNATTRSLAYQV
ncbi:SDR family NAD(P)-dependent oxidoreductase [Streptomyces silvisoli]|uniref:SDR family NAD(P)-dependent oxidoreductase n=1 Tax=Streptomyces silvisoli TaxID=3034235 RepID=A0ABT5ZVR6_9ACTN|nr:SDR family NAD(P)-dependent oxidoreductase [Streptomyces silvisoli]MDF3293912.1 SDR family NAD(P)-dependent oxidoreductase [Streptomyces silvisoli]